MADSTFILVCIWAGVCTLILICIGMIVCDPSRWVTEGYLHQRREERRAREDQRDLEVLRQEPWEADPGRRSRQLLLRNLTGSQRRQFRDQEQFTVTGSRGGEYVIRYGTITNVRNARNTVEGFCAYSPDCTIYDSMLMQKLVIENDEREFRKKAH